MKQIILELLASDSDIRAILEINRSLELKDSWLAAGCVRNFIWNMLSERPGFDSETDVDVIFFDPTYAEAETIGLEAKLKADWPQYRWELRNQAYMHRHSPGTAPYKNACEAMSKYPERYTAIGLRLLANDKLELFAPYGLEDILNFQVRPTPHFLEIRSASVCMLSAWLRRIGRNAGPSWNITILINKYKIRVKCLSYFKEVLRNGYYTMTKLRN